MKATVQYNDFIGTSAADISDHSNLNAFLANRGIDTDRYDAIGANFYSGYSHFFSASIICIDNEQSTDQKKHIVKLSFESEFGVSEFLDLFKRLEVVVTKKYGGYQDHEIDEEITVDDRGELEK